MNELNKLHQFLIEAKTQTYSNENAPRIEASRAGSKDYQYENGEYIYHDTYFGGIRFIGEEVVYKKGEEKPFWGMNYYGVTLDETLSEEAVDKALRPALMLVGKDDVLPLRGPKIFINGEYRYTFNVIGDLDSFMGEEIISKNENKIYILKCHGGLIKN